MLKFCPASGPVPEISCSPKLVVALMRQVVEFAVVIGFQVKMVGVIATAVAVTGYQVPDEPFQSVQNSRLTVAPAAPE